MPSEVHICPIHQLENDGCTIGLSAPMFGIADLSALNPIKVDPRDLVCDFEQLDRATNSTESEGAG